MTTKLISFSMEQQQSLSSLSLTSPSFLSYLLQYQQETIRGISVRLPGNYVHYSLLSDQQVVPGQTTVGDLKMKVLNVVYVTDSQERIDECVLCRLGVRVDGLHEIPVSQFKSSDAQRKP